MIDRKRRIGDREHPFNIQPWLENYPSPVRLDAFQKRIEQITGYDPDGNPRHRIVWGCDLEKARIWNRYRNEWVPKYFQPGILYSQRLKKVSPAADSLLVLPEFDHGLYGTPRFYIEYYAPKERVVIGAEAGYDADFGAISEQRMDEAVYVPMIEIAIHDQYRSCCQWNAENQHECHGWYREPDQGDLERLQKLWYEFLHQPASTSHDPRKGLSPAQHEHYHRQAQQLHQNRMQKLQQQMEDSAERFFDDALKNAVWSFGASHTTA